jgi:SAM-dependent MidA family methyltransferase
MNPLFDIIRREIGQCGVLPFARFMELALYCPKHGYYETQKDNPGRRGDFYTSVGVGEVFGQLLATRFAEWLQAEVRSPQSTVHIVEAGAHDGKLAGDILGWLRTNRPELFGKLEYWIIEPSAVRQEWQRETLKDFSPRVRWLQRFNDSMLQRFNGIIFCNELLDAMPVRRFGWDAAQKTWFEWGVTVDGEKFVWTKVVNAECGMRNAELNCPSSLLEVLPDGYTIEICPAAASWWREAANALERGKLMTIDYGLTADELFSPGRPNGTLRAYCRHQVSDDVLVNPGQQDITAHVNFSAIQQAGEEAGLKTDSFQTQAQFLTQILAEALKSNSPGEWNLSQTRQFQTLTHPEHLGRGFRVLIQSR